MVRLTRLDWLEPNQTPTHLHATPEVAVLELFLPHTASPHVDTKQMMSLQEVNTLQVLSKLFINLLGLLRLNSGLRLVRKNAPEHVRLPMLLEGRRCSSAQGISDPLLVLLPLLLRLDLPCNLQQAGARLEAYHGHHGTDAPKEGTDNMSGVLENRVMLIEPNAGPQSLQKQNQMRTLSSFEI